jgi:hypothetical protein
MDALMRTNENEGRDWAVIGFILLFGLFWILVAAEWALRFAPHWELNTNVESKLDPDSDFLTNKPGGFIEPVDPAILTNSTWMNAALTPGASFPTLMSRYTATAPTAITSTLGTPVATQTAAHTMTAPVTITAPVLANPTNTSIYVPPPLTSTSKPRFVATSTGTATPTPTSTATATATSTSTATGTATATNTVDVSEPDYGGPDGNAIMLANGTSIEFNLSGFSIDGDSAWDLVYYEKESTSAASKIHLGAVLIEAYDETTGTWYAIYNWGDGIVDANASYNNGNSEPDGFPVNKNLLYGVPPLNTGIAIDLDAPSIAQGGSIGDSITKIRIISLSNNDCDVDALQILR